MEKKLLVVLVVVGLCSTVAMALDPMGPPTAGLKQGQFNGSLEYSYSDMDLKLTGGKYSETGSVPIKLRSTTLGAQMNKVYANLGYGITDNWEAFIRLGGASGKFDYKRQATGEPNYTAIQLDNDFAFAYGFGTKVTLWEQSPELKWGGLFQMSWAKWDTTTKGKDYAGGAVVGVYSDSAEISINEIQLAAGPTWTPTQGVSIYGGPFLHFVYGDLEENGKEYDALGSESWKGSYDISEDSCFGGYIGAQIQLGENACVSAEWMTTGDADAFGASVICRF